MQRPRTLSGSETGATSHHDRSLTAPAATEFANWVRRQLAVRRISQRILAQRSGVDHTTVSRLLRGTRTPSLGTATKLARGLRELGSDGAAPQYLRLLSASVADPIARVEEALRADAALSAAQVRRVMESYLLTRMSPHRRVRPVRSR